LITNAIKEWFQELLIDGIISNLSGMFDTVNAKVGEIAGEVGMTPSAWNGSIFSMIRSLSETVILPIAGIILTFVMCYELIQIVIDKNSLHDMDSWIFFKWIFKTMIAVIIVTNTWNLVMGVFDLAQHVVNQSAGVIISDAGIDITGIVTDLEVRLSTWGIGALLGLWFQSIFVGLTMHALSICIFLVIYGRMIEIYLTTSIAPIPLATMVNREWGGMGQNYLKSLLALGFQAFLIMTCVGIYAVLVQGIGTNPDITTAIWTCMGYTVLLCFTLFKTGSLAKSLFSAH
jgi:hypothetical protein